MSTQFRIVETGSISNQHLYEQFVNLPAMSYQHAQSVIAAIASGFPINYPKQWRVVPEDYEPYPFLTPLF